MKITKKEFYTISEFGSLIQKSRRTLLRWDVDNVLNPHHVAENGYRYYSHEQYKQYFKEKYGIDIE